MPPAAAIAGAAVVSAGSSIIAGNKAAKAQKNAAKQASDTELQMYNQTREDQTPYRVVGGNALYKLADLYGVSRPMDGVMPEGAVGTSAAQTFTGGKPGLASYFGGVQGVPTPQPATPVSKMTPGYEGFQTSPGYQFRLGEGLKAVERSAAARGLLGSGATMKAIDRYAEGLASSEYENYANRLAALAGVGQTSTNTTAEAGAAAARGVSGAQMAAGNARASSYANTGAAINNGAQNLATLYLAQQNGFGAGQFNDYGRYGLGNPGIGFYR